MICAKPEDRPALAERTAHAISLERAVIAGLAPARAGADALVDELAEHLRALLRDTLCGHLDPDLARSPTTCWPTRSRSAEPRER